MQSLCLCLQVFLRLCLYDCLPMSTTLYFYSLGLHLFVYNKRHSISVTVFSFSRSFRVYASLFIHLNHHSSRLVPIHCCRCSFRMCWYSYQYHAVLNCVSVFGTVGLLQAYRSFLALCSFICHQILCWKCEGKLLRFFPNLKIAQLKSRFPQSVAASCYRFKTFFV